MFSDKAKLLVFLTLLTAFSVYSTLLYINLPATATSKQCNTDALRGKQLWQAHNCNACHQVYGLGGYLGPDLTNVYSKKGTAYITAFLKNGTAIMPNFHLSPEEIKSLLSYLQHIDASGTADPKHFTTNNYGAIH